jgi:phosphoglycerol transferase
MSFGMAVALSVVFSFLPFHINRSEQIIGLAYFWVPLQTLVLIWLYSKRPLFFKWEQGHLKFNLSSKKAWIALAVTVLSGFSSGSYAFFFLFFCLIASLHASFVKKQKYILISGLVLLNLTAVSLTLSRWVYPSTRMTVSQMDSEKHGLRLAAIILPNPNHWVKALQKLRWRYQSVLPAEIEGTRDTVGILGAVGFFFLLFQFLLPQRRIHLFAKLAPLTLSAVLMGMVGGLGSIFALIFSPAFPYWNRVSSFLAFFAFLAIGMFLDHTKWKDRRVQQWVLPILVLAIGVFDEVMTLFGAG